MNSSVDGGIVRFTSRGEATFEVRSRGHVLAFDPEKGLDPGTLRLILLQPGLAAVLHARGRLVLHASLVSVGGLAVAFAGFSGSGKSSIAAALVSRGHRAMVDDVVAVHMAGGHAYASSGYGQLKLHPPVTRALELRAEDLEVLQPDIEKKGYRLAGRRGTVPLGGVYVMERGATQDCLPLTGTGKLVEIVRHSYWLEVLRGAARQRHLKQCGELARCVPVRRVHRGRSVKQLMRLAELIEADVERGQDAGAS